MRTHKRRARAADQTTEVIVTVKSVGQSEDVPEPEAPESVPAQSQEVQVTKSERYEVVINVPVTKINIEDRTITSVVLEPEEADAHNDIMDDVVIKNAAYNFLAGFNMSSKLGIMHTMFGKIGLELVESYLAPMDFKLGDQEIKKGSWVATLRATEDKLWEDVKNGVYKGFSIGGVATVPA